MVIGEWTLPRYLDVLCHLQKFALAAFLFWYWVRLWVALVKDARRLTLSVHATVSILGMLWLVLMPPSITYVFEHYVRSRAPAIVCGIALAFGPVCGAFGLFYNGHEVRLKTRPENPRAKRWQRLLWILEFSLASVSMLLIAVYASLRSVPIE
jgi:hypothetical protein